MTDEVKTVVTVRFHGHVAEESFFVRTSSTGDAVSAVLAHIKAFLPEYGEIAMITSFRFAYVNPSTREVRLS
jgi:hypothetical protein